MEGIIVLNKPKGLTSHDCVNIVRKTLNIKHVGHAGTLDPLAEGVLVIGVGDVLKAFEYLTLDDKVYEFRVCFGKMTSTYDAEGIVIEEQTSQNITDEMVDDVLKSFIGTSKQMPPIYSAIKKDGKQLYQYARENKEIDIEARDVTIYELKRINSVYADEKYQYVDLYAHVSKGTYIRSLAYDIGQKLKMPSSVCSLKRTSSGKFSIDESITLPDLEVGNFSLINIVPYLGFHNIEISCDNPLFRKIKNGMKIGMKEIAERSDIICFTHQNNIFALYQYTIDENNPNNCFYKPMKVWQR